ncbi:OLC1v1032033C1 [Oldenlandia corymbosa var. corymbosa]|uniref:OLC1v1032033C1 n=1 Tax=Oldenlandia corymbosa var. corymbosa TaxID=529605 RepID=A0AAV1CN66_OLDCO|nr:OLC1v1032033C1 [Oldenlandia corymbosa var. corymbosa]
MGNKSSKIGEVVAQKYGVPLYGAGWVPKSAANSVLESSQEDSTVAPPSTAPTVQDHVVIAGGGGEGHSGIRNALLLAKFDFESNSLSDQPVARLETGQDLPYRIAVHPGGEGLICSFPESCRWYEWGAARNDDARSLNLRSSEKRLTHLEAVGQQLALAFNGEGSLLATGGEDGKLRVFKWPSMEIVLNEDNAYTSVKDLHFSLDGKFLVSVGSGPARVWDLTSLTAVASLPKGNDERFCYCKFSGSSDDNQVLYIIAMQSQGGYVSKWSTNSWKKISSNRVVKDAVCSFDVSPDGNLLALGTINGDIRVISSKNLKVNTLVKKAHLGLVTALSFSHDSRYVVSASMDSSTRVTKIKDEKKSGLKWWMVFLIILLAVAVACVVKSKDLLPELLDLEQFAKLKAGLYE